jgi:hypothetical protein
MGTFESSIPTDTRITLTRADYGCTRWRSWCEAAQCEEPPKERWDKDMYWLRGWWAAHVCETGHTVVIEMVTDEVAS